MKPVTFYPRRELIIWLILFGVSNGINIFGIVHYKTHWKELFTQLGYVFVMSVFLYIVVVVIRLVITLIRQRNH
jgi:hypothetical protein